MTTFDIPGITGGRAAAVLCVGRGVEPRPDPVSLLPLMHAGASGPLSLAIARQIHSGRCLRVRAGDAVPGGPARVVGEGDALVTGEPGIALGIATADCVPLVAVDPVARALAVVHAGWRGTLAGVLRAAIAAMRDDLRALPERILVGAGPAAGRCCYEVGADVIEAFRADLPEGADAMLTPTAGGKGYLDLVEANRLQALAEGIDPDHFGAAGICTVCSPDRCHSYRREGPAAGRMWLLAALNG